MSYPIEIPEALMSLTPGAEWSLTDNTNYTTLNWLSTDISKPTETEVQDEIDRLTLEQPLTKCKEEAKNRIAAVDWSVLPDVGLSNSSEFVAYRTTLRNLIKNPVSNPSFPTEPQPVWL